MAKIILILFLIGALSLGMMQIADEPGKVAIDWSNYHIETSLLFMVAATAFFALLVMIVYALGYMVFSAPARWSHSRSFKRNSLGLSLLTESFAAITAGDMKSAQKKLTQAKKYMPDQPMTLMLAAQIARSEGNEQEARRYIEQMLTNDATEFVALRSLTENAIQADNAALAMHYAEKALKTKPSDNWLIVTLCELYARNGKLQDAIKLLDTSLRKGAISRVIYKRESALLSYRNARDLFTQQRYDRAIEALKSALKKKPDLIEGYALLAEICIAKGDIKNACKVLLNGWKIAPDRALREVFLKALDKYTDKQQYFSYARKMLQLYPEHEETHLLAAEVNSWGI